MAYTYYQLTAIDGTNEPLAYFRYDGLHADYWAGSDWQPSKIFMDKLHEGDPMLDKLDGDPTVKKAFSTPTLYILDALAPHEPPSGTITNHNGALAYTGEGKAFAETVRFDLKKDGQPFTDPDVWQTISGGYTQGNEYLSTNPSGV
jgi:hypothetical protein